MSKKVWLLLFFTLLIAAFLLSGCQPQFATVVSAGKATPPPTPKLILTECTTADGYVRAECGVLSVPEDRTNPNGRKLDLKVIVVRARDANPEPDPLFYLAGGPGSPATDTSIVISVKTIFWEVNEARDIVFLDQRGSNDRHRLTCDPIPDEVNNGTQQQMNDWMSKCLSNLDGDPRFLTSAAFIRDIDDARAALGYDKINLYGISYGAAAGQVYMRMFPEHVRAVVMDHGTALDLPFRYVLPRASQSALDQIFTYCEQDEKCHVAYPDIRGDWKKVFDRLSKGPVITSYTPPGGSEPASIYLENFVQGLHDMMYSSGTYGKIPFLIHRFATNEDWTPIVKSLSEQNQTMAGDNRLLLMLYVIFCFDPAWGTQPEQVAQYSPDSYYQGQEEAILRGQQKICMSLPKPDPSLIYGPGKPVPLSALMMNSLIDPQNPPPNMEPALKEFTKSRIVVEPTEGHDTSRSGCRWGIITNYIQQGSVDGLDISCMDEQKPSLVSIAD